MSAEDGQRSEDAERQQLVLAIRRVAATELASEDWRSGDDSGGLVQKLFGGGGKHCMQGTGQLPTVVGQMVSVTVGQPTNQAMVAQEASGR